MEYNEIITALETLIKASKRLSVKDEAQSVLAELQAPVTCYFAEPRATQVKAETKAQQIVDAQLFLEDVAQGLV